MTPDPPPLPGPRLPRWVQTLAFRLAPARFTDACRRQHGDLVRFHTLLRPPIVTLFAPELVRELFRVAPHRLGSAAGRLEPLVGAGSLLVLEGDEHLRQRRLLLPAFHGDRLRAQEAEMEAAADRQIDLWPVGRPFALLSSMQALTLEVILGLLMGRGPGPERDELRGHIRATLDGGRGMAARRRAMDELLYAEIGRRRREADLEQRDDVVSLLLRARDERGRGLDDRQVRDEVVTLLLAGHETSASGLAWAFELLHRHPAVLSRLRARLAGGDGDYLDAVVREALRLRPVLVGMGRTVQGEPLELGDHRLAPGTQVHFSIAGLHRRPDLYPAPEDFRPERFLGPAAPDAGAWIPFGGGSRRCLGASFALLEMRVVIRRVLERTTLSLVERRPERPARRLVVRVPHRGVRVVQPRPPLPVGGRNPSAGVPSISG